MLRAVFTKSAKGAATGAIKTPLMMARMVGRGLQFLFALIVIGLYGSRVSSDSRHGLGQDPAWVFALFVGGISSITSALFAIPQPFISIHRLFPMDFFLLLMWIVVFGIFASTFLSKPDDLETYEGTSVSLMKGAVWVDLVNCCFWAITGGYGCFATFFVDKVENKVGQKLDDIETGFTDKVEGQFPGGMGKAQAAHEKYGHFIPKVLPKVLDKVHLKK